MSNQEAVNPESEHAIDARTWLADARTYIADDHESPTRDRALRALCVLVIERLANKMPIIEEEIANLQVGRIMFGVEAIGSQLRILPDVLTDLYEKLESRRPATSE